MSKSSGSKHDHKIRPKLLRRFRSIFVAREDAYAVWRGDQIVAVREPLSDEVLAAHLAGEYRAGTYLIMPDGKTPFLVFDVDEQNRKLVRKIFRRLRKRKVMAYVERSKSKGFHIWVFFDKPVRAARVRQFAGVVLSGLENHKIEVFPKQDKVSAQGLGNCIWLPLFRLDVKKNRTVFLDEDLNPHANQGPFLRSIRRTSGRLIKKICREFKPRIELRKPFKSVGGPIKFRTRNNTLTSLAGAMRRRGATQDAILAALREENQRRCEPPLAENEVGAIAASISRYDPAPTSGPYCIQDGHICAVRETKDGPVTTPLCNFEAHVTEEVALDDGIETTRAFMIEGQLDTGERLSAARVPATRYAPLNWVTENWGVQAIVNAGFSKRDQLREAIQRLSPEPNRRTIYTHTGWREIDGKCVFLTSAGGVGVQGVDVDLGGIFTVTDCRPLQKTHAKQCESVFDC